MMRSCVSVPVLSVHNTSMAPKFWIELSRLTMTFRRDIASAPLARLTVTIMGSISGVTPTATATANNKRLEPIALGKTVNDEDQRGHHQDETEHQPGES